VEDEIGPSEFPDDWHIDQQSKSSANGSIEASSSPNDQNAERSDNAEVTLLGPQCPYCGSVIESDPVDCPSCGTTYHFDCAAEAGGCIEAGCSASVLSNTTPPPPPPPPRPYAAKPDFGSDAIASHAVQNSSASKSTSKLFKVGIPIAALLVGLIIGTLATKSNFASAVVGESYSKSDVFDAREEGYKAGHESGKDTGYSSGRSAGYSAGLSEGKSAGCKSVFTSLGTTRVVDYYDWLLDLRSPTYLASYQC